MMHDCNTIVLPPPQITPPPHVTPPPPPPHVTPPPPMIFQHPFTMTVSGPTSCGKTTWVKKLLDNCNILINPKPTRIIWLYRRWQGLYDELKNTVCPHIEFIQGIPAELADDAFISPRENNIIVLDDLMSTASKDSRITDLFTESSHHRNLSVLILNQNLYHSKDPTQRRNCHYLTLFNNPIDKQPIMTLARQMVPRKLQIHASGGSTGGVRGGQDPPTSHESAPHLQGPYLPGPCSSQM